MAKRGEGEAPVEHGAAPERRELVRVERAQRPLDGLSQRVFEGMWAPRSRRGAEVLLKVRQERARVDEPLL